MSGASEVGAVSASGYPVVTAEVDSLSPGSALVRDLARLAGQSGFSVSASRPGNSVFDAVCVERRIDGFVDRMVLTAQIGLPSMIFRYAWDPDYPWISTPPPMPVDYEQGDIAEVLAAAAEWART